MDDKHKLFGRFPWLKEIITELFVFASDEFKKQGHGVVVFLANHPERGDFYRSYVPPDMICSLASSPNSDNFTNLMKKCEAEKYDHLFQFRLLAGDVRLGNCMVALNNITYGDGGGGSPQPRSVTRQYPATLSPPSA